METDNPAESLGAMTEITALPSAVAKLADELDADLFLFSASITADSVETFLTQVYDAPGRKNGALFLSTYGGDPHSAYRLARILKRRYESLVLFVLGPCKSAGTLVALGADVIVMSDDGELGPLDVQVYNRDEIAQRSSGLDAFKALAVVSQQAFQMFEHHFLSVIDRSLGNITTKTAAEIARHTATQLLSPITAQIDPLRLGEVQRAIEIAQQYGKRLGASDDVIRRLIYSYPSHGFVIDIEEAGTLFKGVREATDDEELVERGLRALTEHEAGYDCIASPHHAGYFGCLNPLASVSPESETDAPDAGSALPEPSHDAEDGKPDDSARTEDGSDVSTAPVRGSGEDRTGDQRRDPRQRGRGNGRVRLPSTSPETPPADPPAPAGSAEEGSVTRT